MDEIKVLHELELRTNDLKEVIEKYYKDLASVKNPNTGQLFLAMGLLMATQAVNIVQEQLNATNAVLNKKPPAGADGNVQST